MENKLYSVLLVIILVIFIAVFLSIGLIEFSLNVASLHENTTYSTSQEWEINTNIGGDNDSRWNLTNYSSKLESEIVAGDVDLEKEGLKNKTDYWIMVIILIGIVSLCVIGLIWYSIAELAM